MLICACDSIAEDLGGGWFPHVAHSIFTGSTLKKIPNTELKFNWLILKGCGWVLQLGLGRRKSSVEEGKCDLC